MVQRYLILLFLFPILSGFSIKSIIASLTGNLIPQGLPKLSATPSGSLSSDIEIVLPQGTKGIIPRISLSYLSGSGNGIVGVGWNLEGIHFISRDSRFGVKYDSTDDFVSSLAGPLVDVSGSRIKFHSRKESWIQFIPSGICGDGPCSWTATDKDGLTYTFGSTADSRIEALSRNGSIRVWTLSQVRDSFGNGYNVNYIEDATNGEYYPKEITYQNRSIQFSYEDRSDSSPNYTYGSLVQTTKRLSEIEIFVDGSLIRGYGLDYSSGNLSGRSILTTLSRGESNAFGSEDYDDLSFTYGSDGFSLQSLSDTNLNTTTSVMNLFVPSGLLVYANAYFGNPLPTQATATEKRLADYLQYSMSMPVPERDSCNYGPAACLCAAYAPCWGGNQVFFENLVSLCLDYNNWGGPTYCASGIQSGLTNWMSMDIDGNGILDFASVVGSETTNSIRLRAWTVKNGTIDSSSSFLSPIIPLHYNTFSQAVDLDGDGRTDFAFENGGKLNVIYSKSTSFSSATSFSNVAIPAANRNMTVFAPYSYFFEYSSTNPKRMAADKAPADWFADMDSNGLADFIHYDGSKFNVYLNQKGSFANPIQISGTSNYFINDFIDMDSDGKSEYVRLVQYSENAQYTALSSQLDDLNSQAQTITNTYNTENNVLNSIINSGVSSVSSSDLNSVIDYYLKGCTYYIASLSLNYSMDDIVLVLNSSGENVACLNTDVNYTDITQLQAALAGGTILASNTLTNDLQLVYANEISPINTQISNVQSQLNTINANSNGTIRYRLDVTTFDLTKKTSATSQYDLGTSADRLQSFFGDVNSDGLPDFLTVVGTKIKVSLNTGNGFASQISSDLNLSDGKKATQFNFGDVNADGLEDVILYNKDSQNVESYLSNGSGSLTYNSSYGFGSFALSEQTTNGVYKADIGKLTIQDTNGDGFADALLVKLWMDKTQGHVFARNSNLKTAQEDDLVSVSNRVQTSTASYTAKHLHSGAIQSGTGDYPNLVDSSPGFLVTTLNTNLGSNITIGETFQYYNARLYSGVRSLARGLGFATFTEKDSGTGFYTITEYFQTDYRLAGIESTQRSYNSSGNLMRETIQSGFQFPNPYGTEISAATNISKSSYHNGDLEVSSNEEISYDNYGFPTNQIETIGNHTVITTNTYSHDTSNWRIGRTTRTKKTVDGGLVQDQLFSYSGDSINSLTQFPGNSVEQTSTFTYDSLGNPITITNAIGATTTLSYDAALSLFPSQSINALGHVTKTEYDISLGVEISKTDPNGAKSSKTYDPFGRLLTVTYPGNEGWNESYEYSNTGKYDLNDLSSNESIKKIVRDTTSGVETVVVQYTDPMGKVIRTISDTATSGVNLIEDTVYDYTKDTISKKTKPYFSNGTPIWITYQYDDPDFRLTREMTPDSGGNIATTISYNGLTTTISIQYPDGQTKTIVTVKNELGQEVSKSQNGKTITTTYAPNGQPSIIADPTGKTTTFTYDISGRRISVSDQNSGTVSFSYDLLGRILKQTDARGKSIDLTYDPLDRVLTKTASGGETPVTYTYDENSVSYAIGRTTKIIDSSGSTEFSYNAQGKPTLQKKTIDDIALINEIEYDSLGRETDLTYPDGTKVHQSYSLNGNLQEVTMDSVDGTSVGISVAKYEGPIFADGSPTFRKIAGNGVTTDTVINSINFRTSQLISKKEDGTTLSNLSYGYDGPGNILTITDNYKSVNNQTFTYDTYNRITKAVGNYGTENYVYADNGNLIQKGDYTFTYGDSSHVNAVTKAYSQTSGTLTYSYDASGNMIFRNGDVLLYDTFGKMKEVDFADGGEIEYSYNYAGNRIRTLNKKTNAFTYYFDDLYEIINAPGVPSKHTVYIKGFQGEILTQITREDAVLVTKNTVANTSLASEIRSWLDDAGICSGVLIDCEKYWKNRFTSPTIQLFTYSKYFHQGIPTIYTRIGYILFFLTLLYAGYPFFLKGNEVLKRMKYVGLGSPILLLSVFGVLILEDCNGILGTKHKNAPWFLLAGTSFNSDITPVSPNQPGKSNSSSKAGTPAVGAYFYQTDHLGSTTMLTDGYGNQVTGPGQSGVSFISYKPYGEINYANSTGPDIFRYKFTGQMSDSETGMYYYKSRYYDAFLGRFAQADDRFDQGINGLNRYMYVGGNPVNSVDPNGHSWLSNSLSKAGNWLKKSLFIKSMGLLDPNRIDTGGVGRSIQERTFISHDRWRPFENRKVGKDFRRAFYHPSSKHGLDYQKQGAVYGYLLTGTIEGAYMGYKLGASKNQSIAAKRERNFQVLVGSIEIIGALFIAYFGPGWSYPIAGAMASDGGSRIENNKSNLAESNYQCSLTIAINYYASQPTYDSFGNVQPGRTVFTQDQVAKECSQSD
ncbi:hypothetical protein EHR06_14305 [Leptospira dzoumogneensis]|uniref:Type IV secretion protein Rhs n=2 Tax=Leptospira dzoumogneensis TaxID=2484904 RepID=A0A4Z1ARX1_9LEPT|nr:hypothetical protein EHR06_14305 [Leptospira dzoumogneensis]